jgi:hypothetical protein
MLTRTFWLTALNVVLGLFVLAPLLLVLWAVVREVVGRIRRRRRDVEWTVVPGVGKLPVLIEDGGHLRPIAGGPVRRS